MTSVVWVCAAVAQPPLRARPTPEDIKAAWPASAAKAGVEGVSFMRCRVASDGGATDCAVLKAFPEAQGFGPALASLSPKFRFDRSDAGQEVVLGASWPPPETFPDWPRDPARTFGGFLRRMSGEGSVRLACIVEVDGAFSNCVVALESEPGGALGRAALEAVSKAKARPATYQGRPVLSMMQIPFNTGSAGH